MARFLYWDSCVFLSYIEAHPERIQAISSIIEEIKGDESSKIYTSSLSIVEVAFAAEEKNNGILDPAVVDQIDLLWEDDSVVTIVEFNRFIARMARKLMRDSLPHSLSLKPNDAVHLATAEFLIRNNFALSEFHTYDEKLISQYGPMIGVSICKPHPPAQLKMTI